jgi:hypothetical protein
MTKLFCGSLGSLDVQKSGVHGSRSPLYYSLDLLVALHELCAELLVFQHCAEDIGMRHWQFQEMNAL